MPVVEQSTQRPQSRVHCDAAPGGAWSQRTLFALVFAAYGLHNVTLHHRMWFGAPFSAPMLLGWGLAVAAAALFLKPGSGTRLLAFAAAWAGFLWLKFHEVVNHEMLTLFLVSALLIAAAPRRPGSRPVSEAWNVFVPVGRWCLLILYFFVVFHKLNDDYFNPDVSCAWIMYVEVADWTHSLPVTGWLRMPMIVGVLTVEALLPILLFLRGTRAWAILLGIVFHACLALHNNLFVGDFSLLMMTLYCLFIPDSAWELASRRLNALYRRFRPSGGVSVARWSAIALFLTFLIALRIGIGERFVAGGYSISYQQFANRAFFWIVTSAFTVITLAGWSSPRRPFADGLPGWAPPRHPATLVAVVMILWGFAPYFGLGTASVFAMFSNVRFEEGHNHWLMPESLRWAPYSSDVVELVDTSDTRLLEAMAFHRRPRLAWRRRLSAHADPRLWVTVESGGRRETLRRDDEPVPEIFLPVPLHLAWLRFREVPPPTGPAPCQH